MNKMVGVMIGLLIGVEIASVIASSIATATGTGGTFEATAAGTILDLVPLVFVVGLLVLAFWNKTKA